MNWINKISSDIGEVPNFITYHERQLEEAKKEISTKGNIEKNLSELPGITEYRFAQLQEVEAVVKVLELQLRKIRKEKYVEYERYNKALSSREVEKYVDGEDDVVDMELVINEVAYIRNRYLGIMKGLENKGYMLPNITKLRVIGMEDAELH